MKPEHLNKIVSLHLLKDRKYYYIACNGSVDQEVVAGSLMVNLMPGTGLRSLPVNGELYCFEKSGEVLWFNHVPNQMIVLDDFADLPIVQLTSRYQRWMGAARAQAQQYVAVNSYEKRTGKLMFENKDNNTSEFPQQFHSLKVDVRGRKVELISYNKKVVHYFDGSSGAGKEGGGKDGRPGGKTGIPEMPGTGTAPGFGPGGGPAPPPPLPPGGGFRPKLRGQVEGRLSPAGLPK